MAENPFDGPYQKGTTEYERYLRTDELLGLQKPSERRTHRDELLFQVVHQVEELWMKLAIHEMGECVLHLGKNLPAPARSSMNRAVELLRLCEQQLRLFEHMQPAAYIDIRKGLGQGSGMDSPGFKRLNEIAPEVWQAFEQALERAGVDLLEMYQEPESSPDMLAVAEEFVNLDAAMQRFKLEHLMIVRRIIGMGTASLRGNPAEMLERSARLTFFPMLWAVRDRLFLDFKSGDLAT